MTNLFLEILNMSFSATWLVLAVIALRILLKKSPKWIHVLLWGLVAFRLLCPFSLESTLSLIPSTEVVSPEIMLDPTPQIQTGVDSLNAVVNPIITETFAPATPLTSANPLQIWIPVSAALWCCGMTLMLLYTLISYLRLRHQVRMAIRVKQSIYLSEFVSSPFVLGIFRPRIYLPYHMDEQDRTHVIAHERTHIYRRDHWWKPLGFLLLTIHWFNPLMWLAYILLCRDIELACDERVIEKLQPGQRADYSQALLHCSVTHRAITACPIAFGEVGVRQRVKNVLSYQKPAFWVIAACLLLVAVVSVCFLTDPKTTDPELLLSILREDGHTINGQSPQTISVGIDKSRLPNTCFTSEGHTFRDGEIVIYDNGGSSIFLRRICLDDDPAYVRITYEFTYDLSDSGKALLPFGVPKPHGQAPAIVNELTGEETPMEQITSLPGLGNDEPLTVAVRMETAKLQPDTDVISLEVGELNLLTYTAKDLPVSVLGKTYMVTDITYDDPRYSSIWSNVNEPYCAVTQDCHFLTKDSDAWKDRGKLELLTLTKANFDAYFSSFPDAAALRRENQQAWKAAFTQDGNEYLLYLLRQKNNDVYLVYGYSGSSEPVLRWLLKLAPCDQTDWVISMSLFQISRTDAMVELRQVGAVPSGFLTTGRYYDLQVWNGSDWDMVPSLTEQRVFTTEAIVLIPDSSYWEHLNWEDDYGSLPDGRYRIRKDVTLESPDGTHEDRLFYAEFTIGAPAEQSVLLSIDTVSPTDMVLQETILSSDAVTVGVNDFRIETLRDGQWSYLEPTVEIESVFNGTQRNPREYHNADGNRITIDWSHLYGELPPGQYRIAREYTFYEGSTATMRTAYAEFTIGSDFEIGLFLDRLSEDSITVQFLAEDTLPAGEYFCVDAYLQRKETYGGWTDVISIRESPRGKNILTEPSIDFLWQEKNYRLTEGDHRIALQIRHILPDGTTQYGTLYQYFNPSTYAWGVSTTVSGLSREADKWVVTLQHSGSQNPSDGSLTMSHTFGLEKRENNQWVDMGQPRQEIPNTQHPVSAAANYETERIVLNPYFGDLQSGTYRLVKYVTRRHGDGTTETRPIYAVFVIYDQPAPASSAGPLGDASVEKAQLLHNGEVLVTQTNTASLGQLADMFRNAITAEPPPEEVIFDLEVSLSLSDGSTLTAEASTQDDLCRIGDQYYDYGPDDARETFFRHFGITWTEPEILQMIRSSVRDSLDNQDISTRILALLKEKAAALS